MIPPADTGIARRRPPPQFGWCAVAVAASILALIVGANAASAPATAAQETGLSELTSYRVGRAPVLDGQRESLWAAATPAMINLKRGRRSTADALVLELRCVYTSDQVFFLATWPGDAPAYEEISERNSLIMHFESPAPWPGAADVMCLAACHTAYVDNQGRGRYVTSETIPPGQTDPLQLGGGWQDGRWAMEWGRPLVSENPFDVQFADLGTRHRFFVKVIEGRPDQPDPISDDMLLLFQVGP